MKHISYRPDIDGIRAIAYTSEISNSLDITLKINFLNETTVYPLIRLLDKSNNNIRYDALIDTKNHVHFTKGKLGYSDVNVEYSQNMHTVYIRFSNLKSLYNYDFRIYPASCISFPNFEKKSNR